MVSWFVVAVATCVHGALEPGTGREMHVLECLCGGCLSPRIACGYASNAAHRRIGLGPIRLGIVIDDAKIVDGMWPGQGRVREVQQVGDFAQRRGWPCVHGQGPRQGASPPKVGERSVGSARRMWATYRKSVRDTTHRTTNGASCTMSVTLQAYIVLCMTCHAGPKMARQATCLVPPPP